MEFADALQDKNRAHLDSAVDKRDPLIPPKERNEIPPLRFGLIISLDSRRAVVQAIHPCAAGFSGPLWGGGTLSDLGKPYYG